MKYSFSVFIGSVCNSKPSSKTTSLCIENATKGEPLHSLNLFSSIIFSFFFHFHINLSKGMKESLLKRFMVVSKISTYFTQVILATGYSCAVSSRKDIGIVRKFVLS
jgi:hypothetical protein